MATAAPQPKAKSSSPRGSGSCRSSQAYTDTSGSTGSAAKNSATPSASGPTESSTTTDTTSAQTAISSAAEDRQEHLPDAAAAPRAGPGTGQRLGVHHVGRVGGGAVGGASSQGRARPAGAPGAGRPGTRARPGPPARTPVARWSAGSLFTLVVTAGVLLRRRAVPLTVLALVGAAALVGAVLVAAVALSPPLGAPDARPAPRATDRADRT